MANGTGGNLKDIPPLSDSEKKAARDSNESQSTREVVQIASGKSVRDLKREADENEARRTEAFRDHFECLAVITLYLSWGLFVPDRSIRILTARLTDALCQIRYELPVPRIHAGYGDNLLCDLSACERGSGRAQDG